MRRFGPAGPWPCLWLVIAVLGPLPARAEDAPVDYNRDIRPILSNTCYKCHGPDEAERQAGLRLDEREPALAELDSGSHAIVPGDSGESELWARISSTEPSEQMPPPDSGKSLTGEQIKLLQRWIDEGAEWREHWSLVPPERREPPAVKREEMVRNAIDRFVLARLEQEGIEPSPPADRVTLIRRVSYDLTGLPPTPAEVDAFVADPSPEAYERLVDRLLASPRYGEHMARYWLDAARYGDTHGLHFDNERSLWPYRDWVINAFNRNMPFDQFTVEQLAGDLLPEPTLEQRIATGFNRCNVSTSEGGSIDEEVLVRYAVDRVETTSAVWLGLTTGCAVCHDHKFDPISQREFYQLFAYFNGVADKAMDGNAKAPPPIVATPSEEQAVQQVALNEQLSNLRERIAAELARVEYTDPGASETDAAPEPHEYVWIDDALPSGAKPEPDAAAWQFVAGPEHPVFSGGSSTTRTADGVSQHFFTGAEPGLRVGEGDKLFAYVYLDPANPPKEVMLQFNDGSWEHRATWGDDLISWGEPGSASRLPVGPLPEAGQWVRLEVEASRVGLAAGTVLNGWAFTQFGGTVHWDKAGIVTRSPQAGEHFESQVAWEAFERAQTKSALPPEVQEVVKLDAPARNEDQKKRLRDYFLEHVYGATRAVFDPLHQERKSLETKIEELKAAIPTSMVMHDLPEGERRETFLLVRGAYDKKGDKVLPGVPSSLPPLPAEAPANRLGLARWLVDPGHPLTARVTVNRFWQHYFGTAIVKTAGDFGAQGSWPTHPELLDWLATEFIRSGWDVKRMQKLIVTSATYRQSSQAPREAIERDPENELLARGPRFRMDAEMIRDAALATSGLLVERLGGPSVKPYQPEGLWEAVGFVGSNTAIFKQDQGDALYRRSLYTFWKRTSPPPSLTTFDAPSRETCTVRRPRTNTPLQALVLLNDKQFVEAARELAERLMKEGGQTVEERIGFAFRLATARLPDTKELEVLSRVYQAELAEFRSQPEAAARLLGYGDSPYDPSLDAGELAAWTMLANLVLNLDETITKE